MSFGELAASQTMSTFTDTSFKLHSVFPEPELSLRGKRVLPAGRVEPLNNVHRSGFAFAEEEDLQEESSKIDRRSRGLGKE